MKKITIVLAALIASCSLFSTVSAEPTDAQVKMAQKDATKRAKDLGKKGWEMVSSIPMATALQQHFMKLEAYGGTYMEYAAQASNRTISAATTQARNLAAQYFAQDAKSAIQGKLQSLTDVSEDDTNKFNAIFSQMVVSEIEGVLKPSFILKRVFPENSEKTEVLIYYICDPQSLKSCNEKSVQEATRQTNLSDGNKQQLLNALEN